MDLSIGIILKTTELNRELLESKMGSALLKKFLRLMLELHMLVSAFLI